MRKSWLLCVLLGTMAWGQAAPSAPPPQQPAPVTPAAQPQAPAAPVDTSASVPATAPVITITGVCPPQPKPAAAKSATAAKPATAKTSAADCKTVITKAEFEKLANALAPNVTPQLKKQLAGMLPRVMAMSDEAKKRGLEKSPDFAEKVKFMKMQILTQSLQQQVQKEAAEIPPADIEKYYNENPQMYEQYNLDRIFIPKSKQIESDTKMEDEEKMTDEQKKAKEEAEKQKTEEAEKAMTKLADDLRARAAAGDDFTRLQKEAFDAAGMKIESPTVNLPNVRRSGLPPTHAAVYDLKDGEISQVISDNGGHYIYKLIGKTKLSLDQVKVEIRSKLTNDRMREAMDKLNGSFKAETNEAYFGPGGVGPTPPPRMPRPRPGMPPGAQQTPPPAQPPAAQPN